jgi:DNA-directed RNA polymerase sigma subunit (sigma70/sigma32)
MNIHNTLNRVRNIRKDMLISRGVSPTDEELSSLTGLTKAKLHMLLDADRPIHSASVQRFAWKKGSMAGESVDGDALNEDDPDSKGEMEAPLSADEREHKAHFLADMGLALADLSEDEAFVVKLRFGLGLPRRVPMRQVANLVGAEKKIVKKIEDRALRKLRAPHNQYRLRHYSSDPDLLERALEECEDKFKARSEYLEKVQYLASPDAPPLVGLGGPFPNSHFFK